MAIALNGSPTIYDSGASSVDNYSFNHTINTGLQSSCLIVGINKNSTVTSTVTYNGVSMTKVVGFSPSVSHAGSLWYLANPAPGTHAVAVSGSSAQNRAHAQTFVGVDQINVVGANTATSDSALPTTTKTLSIITTGIGSWLIDLLACDTAITHGSGVVEISQINSAGNNPINSSMSYKQAFTPGSNSMQEDIVNGSSLSMCIFELLSTQNTGNFLPFM